MRKRIAILTAMAMVSVLMVLNPNPAVAAGRITILKSSPTSKVKNIKAFANRNSTNKVYEAGADKTWNFELVAFFGRPLGDNEVTLMFYDKDAGNKYVDSQIKMTRDFKSKILLCRVSLRRPPFDANRRYKVVAQDKDGRTLATGEFTTMGTSQSAIDSQKRYNAAQKEMEKSMKDLERRAKEQEAAEKKRQAEDNKEASDNLF